MPHLRFSDLPFIEQRAAFLEIIACSPLMKDVLYRTKQLNLPNWYIVSGVLYNLVWNVLTEKPETHGIKDIDLFYFDASDLSYEAEDSIITKGEKLFEGLPLPVEIRNQARVHLWFEKHFGQIYSPLQSSEEGIGRFVSKTHAVGLKLKCNGNLDLYAPFGLNDIFSFRITPNPVINNGASYHTKALRAKTSWPELTVLPWDNPLL